MTPHSVVHQLDGGLRTADGADGMDNSVTNRLRLLQNNSFFLSCNARNISLICSCFRCLFLGFSTSTLDEQLQSQAVVLHQHVERQGCRGKKATARRVGLGRGTLGLGRQAVSVTEKGSVVREEECVKALSNGDCERTPKESLFVRRVITWQQLLFVRAGLKLLVHSHA